MARISGGGGALVHLETVENLSAHSETAFTKAFPSKYKAFKVLGFFQIASGGTAAFDIYPSNDGGSSWGTSPASAFRDAAGVSLAYIRLKDEAGTVRNPVTYGTLCLDLMVANGIAGSSKYQVYGNVSYQDSGNVQRSYQLNQVQVNFIDAINCLKFDLATASNYISNSKISVFGCAP